MSVRTLIMSALETDATLAGLVKGFYATNAIDTPEERPFLIVRWEDLQRGHSELASGAGTQVVTIWVHDDDQDYGVIDAALERVKKILGALVSVAGSDGYYLVQVDWTSDSADLIDDGFHTITRYSRYVIAQGWR